MVFSFHNFFWHCVKGKSKEICLDKSDFNDKCLLKREALRFSADFKGIVQRKIGSKLGSNDRQCFSVVVLDIIFYF
jgi:hypothetical protein